MADQTGAVDLEALNRLLDDLRSDIAPTNPDGPLGGDVVLSVTYGVGTVERIIAELEPAIAALGRIPELERVEAAAREAVDACDTHYPDDPVIHRAIWKLAEILEASPAPASGEEGE